MALSNIFREPRREITESAAGITIAAVVIVPMWLFACWFQGLVMPQDKSFRIIGMLIALIGVVLCVGLLFLTHWIGEEVCDALADRGLELRPKQRFN